MKSKLSFLIIVMSAFLASCTTANSNSPDSVPSQTPVSSTSVNTPKVQDNYDSIVEEFSSIFSDCDISVSETGVRVNATLVSKNLSADEKPEDWEDILLDFSEALTSSRVKAEEAGFQELSAQLEDIDGNILVSGYGGEVKFDYFEQSATSLSSVTLGPGQYTVGIDILAGTYNCTAVSGLGVLRGDVASAGPAGFVQTMGSSSVTIGDYSASVEGNQTYNNLSLADGDTLYIEMSLTVRFDPV